MADKHTYQDVKENKMVPMTMLFAHSRNYRSHPPEQIKKLVASLERYGQVRSIVCQENTDSSYTIVAGHGVYEAAEKLKYQELRADILPSWWSAEQVSGYLVSDNELSKDAQDDEELLAQLLTEQQNAGYDLATLGSDDETLRQMLESLGDEIIADGEDLMSISDESTAVEMIKTLKFGSYSIPLTDHEFTKLEARLKDYSKEAGSYYGFVEGLLV